MSFAAERLFEHASRFPDKKAVVTPDASITYGALADRVWGVTCALRTMGVRPGDVAVVEAVPSVDYVSVCYGVHLLGAVFVPVENRLPAARLSEIAERVSADIQISAADPGNGRRHVSLSELIRLAERQERRSEEQPLVFPPEDVPGEILFTTGSTGRSKGVIHNRRAVSCYLETMNASLKMHEGTVMLVVTPLNHAGGLHRMHMVVHCGGTLVLLDGLKDLGLYYRMIREHEVNALYLPPVGVHILLTFSAGELRKLDRQLEFVFTASAPFPDADRERMRSLLPTTRLLEAYGSSEVGSVCNYDYNVTDYRRGCLGRPYANVELRTDGEDSLLQIRSPMLMMGYLNDPELTASVLDKDGWFHTSDRGYIDSEGYLFFLGRNDDVINVAGKKVAPTELEEVVLRCEGVDDCACTSTEDPVVGTSLRLLVVTCPGYAFSPQKILRELRSRVEDYKLPSRIEQVEAIPRLFNGKIDRKKLREL